MACGGGPRRPPWLLRAGAAWWRGGRWPVVRLRLPWGQWRFLRGGGRRAAAGWLGMSDALVCPTCSSPAAGVGSCVPSGWGGLAGLVVMGASGLRPGPLLRRPGAAFLGGVRKGCSPRGPEG